MDSFFTLTAPEVQIDLYYIGYFLCFSFVLFCSSVIQQAIEFSKDPVKTQDQKTKLSELDRNIAFSS